MQNDDDVDDNEEEEEEEENKQDMDVNMHSNNNHMHMNRTRRRFQLMHHEQSRLYDTYGTNLDAYANDLANLRRNMPRDRLSRQVFMTRYRQFHRYRHTIRALHYHNIRRRLRNQTTNQQNTTTNNSDTNSNNSHQQNLHFWPHLNFDADSNSNQNADSNNNALNRSLNARISRIANTFSLNLSDDEHAHSINNLSVLSAKLKHTHTNGRLDGLSDFKAAFALIPLRLTSKDPLKQTIYKKCSCNHSKYEMDEDDDFKSESEEEEVVISGIDSVQNLLSQLSSDLHLIILNMLTGLGNMRTIAIYKSLRSELTCFDMDRVKNCSVYKCQALFVERYRQNLFDEKYKALQQPALSRALSTEPKNLFEFQQDRKARVLRKQCSSESMHNSDFDQTMLAV